MHPTLNLRKWLPYLIGRCLLLVLTGRFVLVNNSNGRPCPLLSATPFLFNVHAASVAVSHDIFTRQYMVFFCLSLH